LLLVLLAVVWFCKRQCARLVVRPCNMRQYLLSKPLLKAVLSVLLLLLLVVECLLIP
jgi:hypothetical protein